MALDANEVGYFISQVGAAAQCFGVSSADITIVAGALNEYFGYRCAPLVIVDGPQLDSICEDCSCPYAPDAQCELYDDGGCYPSPQTVASCAPSAASTYTSSSAYASYTKYHASKYN
jgi:hypothetical protein